MGQVSSLEDIADRAAEAANLDDDLNEVRPIAADLKIRRASTQTCKVDRKDVGTGEVRASAKRNPNSRARPLDYSNPDDLQRRSRAIVMKMHRDMKAIEKGKRPIIVPD